MQLIRRGMEQRERNAWERTLYLGNRLTGEKVTIDHLFAPTTRRPAPKKDLQGLLQQFGEA